MYKESKINTFPSYLENSSSRIVTLKKPLPQLEFIGNRSSSFGLLPEAAQFALRPFIKELIKEEKTRQKRSQKSKF